MREIKFNKNNILLIFILFLSILPVLKIGGFQIPALYLVMLPLGMFILIYLLFGKITVSNILKIIIVIFFLIIIEILISTLNGSVTTLGSFVFPTDLIQYVARCTTLIVFLLIFYKNKINSNIFVKYFLIIGNVAMLIGVLQWVPWPGRELIVKMYPFYDVTYQLNQLNKSIDGIRVHGLAQHATANGGLAMLFFVYGLSILYFYKKNKLLSLSLMILSVINIFASQARAGMLALAFSILLFYLISIYINRKSFKPTVYAFIGTCIFYFVVLYLNHKGNPIISKMIYRWEHLIYEEKGGARVDQFYYFYYMIVSPKDYLLGLSKPVVNQSLISYGVEIEPANIFITYGLLGFILQYGLVIVLLTYFFKRLRSPICQNNRLILAVMVAAFVSLASYQVFSVGYYFFREIRVGLFPWILIGVAIGCYEREKFLLRSSLFESKK